MVILLDEDHQAIGTAPRATVHTPTTPRHLAFSCYLLNDDGELLVTRRALSKKTWPGVWTNSFCGHPRPGESFHDALTRYAQLELGITDIHSISVALPDFEYTATDASGIIENSTAPSFTLAPPNNPPPTPTKLPNTRGRRSPPMSMPHRSPHFS